MITRISKIKLNRDYTKAIVDTIREPLVILDAKLHVITANRSFYKIFHVTKKETENKLFYDLGNGQWDNPKLRHLLEGVLPHKMFFQDLEISYNFPEIGNRIVLLNARNIVQKKQNEPMILLEIEDITEKKHLEQQKDDFISIASHELKTPVTSMKIYTQLLQRDPLITKDERASSILTKIDMQMNRLTELVASFMNVYKVQTGMLILKKQQFSLDSLITEAIGNFQYTLNSHVIEKRGQTKVTIRADRSVLTRYSSILLPMQLNILL